MTEREAKRGALIFTYRMLELRRNVATATEVEGLEVALRMLSQQIRRIDPRWDP